MKPPATIPAAGRAMWRDAVADLQARGVWSPKMCPALLERLVLNRLAAANALVAATAEPVVTGSTGQPTAHPMFAVAARCDQVAMALARQLTLTPQTRIDLADDEDTPDGLEALDAPAQDELAPRRNRRAS